MLGCRSGAGCRRLPAATRQPQQEIPIEPIDAADLEAELRRYAPEARAAAASFLDAAYNAEKLFTDEPIRNAGGVRTAAILMSGAIAPNERSLSRRPLRFL